MRFEPSLFDKLFGNDPTGANPSTVRTLSLDELKNSVAQDLESLLNTRMGFSEAQMESFPECVRSMLTYGLNDFSGRSLLSHVVIHNVAVAPSRRESLFTFNDIAQRL